MKTISTILILLSLCQSAFSQDDLEYIPGEMVIQFYDHAAYQSFENNQNRSFNSLKFKSLVSNEFHLYLYTYEEDKVNKTLLLEETQNQEQVLNAGFNFSMQYRALIPDDTFYSDQWNMDRIDAPEAWELTTGGKTVDGDEIVIAILEGGDIDHEDVQGNIWINKDEIPDDNIDNDGNGYVDDYYGVNVVDSTDTPITDNHSTSVMGIVGAKGNNMMGVAGLNWNTNMMIVSHDLTFTKIIESYEYVYYKRKAWNESNGTEGAFVVATNASFGVDNRKPEDNPLFPIWCDWYDKLGSIGVLSAVATTNSNSSIDDQGDMPAFCSSDYLIAVTESDINDKLDAGYSQTHIDLASPGKNVETLKTGNEYGSFGGTSAATPVVTGSIGLLYSFPCIGLVTETIESPAATALLMKQLIMDGTDKLAEFSDKTKSGGRLNLYNSMRLLQEQFGSQKGKLEIIGIFPNPTFTGAIQVAYKTPEFSKYDVKVYNALGQLIYYKTVPEVCAPRFIDIDLGKNASGVYFISIENANNIKSAAFTVY